MVAFGSENGWELPIRIFLQKIRIRVTNLDLAPRKIQIRVTNNWEQKSGPLDKISLLNISAFAKLDGAELFGWSRKKQLQLWLQFWFNALFSICRNQHLDKQGPLPRQNEAARQQHAWNTNCILLTSLNLQRPCQQVAVGYWILCRYLTPILANIQNKYYWYRYILKKSQ